MNFRRVTYPRFFARPPLRPPCLRRTRRLAPARGIFPSFRTAKVRARLAGDDGSKRGAFRGRVGAYVYRGLRVLVLVPVRGAVRCGDGRVGFADSACGVSR